MVSEELNMPLRNMEYVNVRKSPPHNSNTDKKLLRLVLFSFGILCIIQATLNVTLRLFPYESGICKKQADFDEYFRNGWVYFNTSLYFISNEKKTWNASREYCLGENADLIVINSREEQEFTRRFHRFMWIGLSNTTHNSWTWVDETPLTISFWGRDEPNMDEEGYCVEARCFELPDTWNDIRCDHENYWICEKTIAL